MNTLTTLKTMLALVLTAGLAACAGNTSDDGGDTGSTPQNDTAGNGTPTPAASGSTPEYAISCGGDVTQLTLGSSVGLRCVGGPDGTFGCSDPCAAQDVEVHYVPPANRCGSVDRFAWDGTACKKYLTNDNGQMRCKGADCAKLFTSEADCKAAYDACISK